MKIFHLSDLHIGKRLKEYSMLEDQKYILEQICHICDTEKIDCVLIAGDIYDKTVPPAEAVQVFDEFLYNLSQKKIPVLIISGNHDSAERVSFGGIPLDPSLGRGEFRPLSDEEEAHLRRAAGEQIP